MKDLRKILNEFDKALADYRESDEDGWHEYPTYAPEDPEQDPDDMPKRDDFPHDALGYEDFKDERELWIDEALRQYLVWVKGAKAPRILYWGGNDYEWLDGNGNSFQVIAWQELPEEPLFADEVA